MDGRGAERFALALTATLAASDYLRARRVAAREILDREELSPREFLTGAMHWQLAVLEQADLVTHRLTSPTDPPGIAHDCAGPIAENMRGGGDSPPWYSRGPGDWDDSQGRVGGRNSWNEGVLPPSRPTASRRVALSLPA
jgi:hypothetical protein